MNTLESAIYPHTEGKYQSASKNPNFIQGEFDSPIISEAIFFFESIFVILIIFFSSFVCGVFKVEIIIQFKRFIFVACRYYLFEKFFCLLLLKVAIGVIFCATCC